VSISLHPGTVISNLTRHAGLFVRIFGRLLTYPVEYGAITSLFAGTAPAASELNGKVSIPTSWMARGVKTFVQTTLFSTSLRGHASRPRTRMLSIPSLGRNCGNGVRNKSKTFRVPRLTGLRTLVISPSRTHPLYYITPVSQVTICCITSGSKFYDDHPRTNT
jgi:hypothetical protein